VVPLYNEAAGLAALHGKHQLRERRAGQILRIVVGEILGLDVGEVGL